MAKVLVVDDEPICTRVLALTLGDRGHEVKTAASGEDAIEIGLSFRPEVLISDWKLAWRIDGIEVARALQQAESALEVILFSGLPSEELEERSRDLRVFRILEKPCDIDEVAELINQALIRRSAA